MHERLASLSEREKQTLRFLLAGHDAKSIARELGLAVHTINERRRDCRRKLGVSSSREAARLLGEVEHATPKSFGDKEFGVAGTAGDAGKRRQGAGRLGAWLVGGVLVMLIVVAAVMLSTGLPAGVSLDVPRAERRLAAADAAESAGSAAAREWAALVDGGRWEDSWRAAAAIFRSQVTAEQWADAVRPVRGPLGKVAGRSVLSVQRTNTLPGAPAGEYEVVQFQTEFASREAIETFVMVREGGGWKVSGYFIR